MLASSGARVWNVGALPASERTSPVAPGSPSGKYAGRGFLLPERTKLLAALLPYPMRTPDQHPPMPKPPRIGAHKIFDGLAEEAHSCRLRF
jgi:hypothetical protein